jgi:hypothetical protein
MRRVQITRRRTAACGSELEAPQASAFGGERGALARVRRKMGDAAADNADCDFDGRKADAPPRSADWVGIYVTKNADCAVDAENREDGAAWMC